VYGRGKDIPGLWKLKRDGLLTCGKSVVNSSLDMKFVPVKTLTINNINAAQTIQPMKTHTKWKVNLRTEITSIGDTLDDLRKTIEKLGFDQSDLMSYEKLDTHRDLPLVSFGYPEGGVITNESKLRRIRVTKMDEDVVEGWENETWKKFLRTKIIGNIVLSEIPAKQ
jgi:hypothetical protein